MIPNDLHNRLSFSRGLSPVVATDNTALVTQIIDMSDAMGAEVVILTGTLADADATFAVTVTAGDASDLSDGAAPASSELYGTLAGASFTFAADDSVKSIGYGGTKQYWKVTITPTGNTGNAGLAAVVVKHLRLSANVN